MTMTDDDFVNLVEELQQKIEYEEEKTYSKTVIREYRNPIYFGVLDNPDLFAKVKGPCNDTMKITMKIKNGRITETRFWTDGCGASIACGNMLSKMIKGKTLLEANRITSEDLVRYLVGLPVEHRHCADLAVDTLNKCLKEYKK